jgi:hypothetical protein
MISPTPIDMTSTPALPWLLFFLLVGYGIAACIGDCITTMIGLGAKKGFVEGNPIARWMFAKVGESLTGWIGAVVYALLACVFANLNYRAGVFFAAAVAASETFFTIKNYRLLKKLGIPLK